MAEEVSIRVRKKGVTIDDIREVKEKYKNELLGIDGIWSVGIGKDSIMIFTEKDLTIPFVV